MIVKRIEYLVFLFFVISNLLIGQTYTVNSTNDVDDGTCDGIHCSLREAINDNENGGGGGTINFSVGAAVITLTAALPAMAAQVFIDGTSNTGFVTNTVVPFATTVANPLSYQNMVCIDGGGTGAFDGLVLNAGSDGSLIKGLVLRNFGTAGSFGDYGIHLNSSSSHTITACYIGIDTDGSTTTYNTDIGIYIVNSANNLIGDGTASGVNLISGCNISGFGSFGQIIMSGASSTGNIIKGNIIGLQKDGTTRASKYATGILLTGVGTSNTIGGTGINDGNLISGNSSSGIFCSSITTPQYIYGNRIGTTSTGSSVITGASNPQTYGIYLSNSYSLIIGGTSGSFRNIISANTNSGVYLTGSSSSANQIKGNYIGIASDGATFITSNTQDNGVYLTGSAQRNTIGGTATGEGNVISGNSDGTSTGYGVYLNGVTSNTLLGNTIGPQVGGSTAVTSTTQSHGVYCNGCYGNTIGGNSSTIARNIISGNCDNVSNGYGIYLTGAGASSNTIIGNYIGVNSAGTGRVSNGTQAFGIYLASGAKSNRIGGTSTSDKNVISSNRNVGYTAGTGIHLSAATSNTIIGNVLGLQADGITNSANSISQYNLALYNASFGNYIGGSAAGEGNIISMASQYGLYLDGSGTSGNIVRGNYIGVGSDGATKSGYQEYGVYITNSAAFNTIGGNNTADANVISGNQNNSTSIGYGVYINGVSSNTVTGNIIGLQKDGSTLISSNGQHYGVYLANNSTNNTIGNTISSGRNILSGNATYGAYLTGAGCSGNNIKGNYIGLQSNGTTVVTSSSQDYGIYLTTSASANTIGGTAAGEGNVISGNGDGAGTPTGWGVYLNAASSNTVVGNFIGPQKDGSTIVTSAVASIQAFGVYIANSSLNNVIGNTQTAGGNVISGNKSAGVNFSGSGTTGNIVKGNFIGLQSNGTSFMTSSAQGGVGLAGSYNTIGGTAAGEANVISGNTSGIGVGGTNNSVIGNVIGLQKDGSTYVTSHAQQTGVDISGTNNTVGGANAQRNIISGNEYSGVTITYPGATGNVVKGNYIGLQSNGTSFVTSSTQNYGAYLYDACMYNTIGGTAAGEGNIISGNNDGAAGGYGIYLGSALDYNPESVSSNTIIGNTIGPQADGSTVVTSSTQKYGIYFYDFGDGEYMSNNVIGGNVSGARNIISANTEAGIYISNYTTGASIKGNYIGLASNGTSAIATSSQDYGIYISGGASSNSNTIGGTASAEENTVTGNTNSGIYLNGVSSHTILGNVIGLNRGGLGEVNSDQDYGIYLANGSTNNQIGSGTTGARNIISLNNTAGILLTGASTSGNSIKGNKIGIGSDEDASGISYTIGQRTGISCHSSAHSNTIGGTTSGEGNTISDNGDQLNDSNGTGILLSSVTSHTILGNIIGLNPDGVSEVSTANSSGQGVGIDISNSYGNLIGNGTSSGRNIISGHEYVLTFGYNAWGISISGSSSGNNIKGNYIGLGSDGSTKASNDIGVYLSGTSNGNTIGGTTAGEGNVISGNINSGIILESSGVDNVFGNHIGTQANGMSYVSSNTQLNGIYVNSNNQTIGGNGSGKRNIIGGNETAGIYINTNMTGTIIKGNYIGVGTDGASGIASSSQDAGIHLLSGANGTQIGGTSAGDGNVISANYGALSSGIIFFNNNNNNVVIKGNIIGLAADGTSGTSNYYQNIGIRVVSNTLGLQIGGVSAAEKNIISGNTQNGIRLFSTTTTGAKIQGNYIGCTSTGSAPTGTVQAYGIYISNGNIGNAIGGNSGATGQNPYGNVIAHNGTAGVYLTGASCTGNLISRNLIYSNASGVTLASSANASKAKPSVTAFNGTSVSGTATANDTVEVFKNNTGNCQDAMTYLGSVLANGSGAWSLSGVTINNGESVTATAHSIRQQYL